MQFCETVLTICIRENKTISIQEYQKSKEVYIWQAGTKLTSLNKILEGSVACLSSVVHNEYILWSKPEAEHMDSGAGCPCCLSLLDELIPLYSHGC